MRIWLFYCLTLAYLNSIAIMYIAKYMSTYGILIYGCWCWMNGTERNGHPDVFHHHHWKCSSYQLKELIDQLHTTWIKIKKNSTRIQPQKHTQRRRQTAVVLFMFPIMYVLHFEISERVLPFYLVSPFVKMARRGIWAPLHLISSFNGNKILFVYFRNAVEHLLLWYLTVCGRDVWSLLSYEGMLYGTTSWKKSEPGRCNFWVNTFYAQDIINICLVNKYA